MAFGIDSRLVQPFLGLEYAQRSPDSRGSGFSIRGGFSTKFDKVFGRKLVPQCADRERSSQETTEHLNWKYSHTDEDRRAGLIFSFEELDTAGLESPCRGTGDNIGSGSNLFGGLSAVRSLSEEFTSQTILETAESSSENICESSGVGSTGAVQYSPAAEGVTVACKKALGSGIDRPLTFRTGNEHKLRAVSKGGGETVDMESKHSPVESDVWNRAEKLRQVIADYSYRYHTLDNPVVR